MTRTFYRRNNPGVGTAAGFCLLMLAAVLAISVLVGGIFAFVWNAAVAPTFHVGTLDLWSGAGVVFLLWLVASFFKR